MRGVYEEWMSALRTYADQGGPGAARDFVRQILRRARRNYADILSTQDRT
jgi:hypothetical protein